MKHIVNIYHYLNVLDNRIKYEIIDANKNSSLVVKHNIIDSSEPTASVHEMVLHAYVSLGPEFWSAYLSGALSNATIDFIKYLLNRIGKAVDGKKLEYFQSGGIKETKINYGLKVHPKGGYSLEFHANGDISDEMLGKMFKHVEEIHSLPQLHYYEIYEADPKSNSIKKKKLRKK